MKHKFKLNILFYSSVMCLYMLFFLLMSWLKQVLVYIPFLLDSFLTFSYSPLLRKIPKLKITTTDNINKKVISYHVYRCHILSLLRISKTKYTIVKNNDDLKLYCDWFHLKEFSESQPHLLHLNPFNKHAILYAETETYLYLT